MVVFTGASASGSLIKQVSFSAEAPPGDPADGAAPMEATALRFQRTTQDDHQDVDGVTLDGLAFVNVDYNIVFWNARADPAASTKRNIVWTNVNTHPVGGGCTTDSPCNVFFQQADTDPPEFEGMPADKSWFTRNLTIARGLHGKANAEGVSAVTPGYNSENSVLAATGVYFALGSGALLAVLVMFREIVHSHRDTLGSESRVLRAHYDGDGERCSPKDK